MKLGLPAFVGQNTEEHMGDGVGSVWKCEISVFFVVFSYHSAPRMGEGKGDGEGAEQGGGRGDG